MCMRTNVEIDEELLKKAKKIGKIKTTRAVIDKALRSFIETSGRKSLLELKGRIKFARDYDYKSSREED